MAYLYRHIRKDKDEVFYIGIGSDEDYKRANNKSRRNPYWKTIVNNYGYDVEIMIDDMSWEDACLKETEFINYFYKSPREAAFSKNINHNTLYARLKGRLPNNTTFVKL